MSAEGGEAAEVTPEETGPTQQSLGVYKNPELIESVVVFDPIGGSHLKFLDTTKIYFAGIHPNAGPITAQNWATAGKGPFLLGGTQEPLRTTVCREISNPGGMSSRDLSGAATNPIQFRFDGIPMVLPRESYIEVTLGLVYLGPEVTIAKNKFKESLEGLKSYGWARTASGLIQLVQAVDVSATSFQSPDMTTQNFLEAVQTKDAELVLRPDYYFNSYITGGYAMPEALKDEVTLVTTFVTDDYTYTYPYGSKANDGRTVGPSPAVEYVKLETGKVWPVTFRIPLAALSPVFKTDVLPLYMTNSTSINIQFQVQNPNIPFPLHNALSGIVDQTGKLAKDAWIASQGMLTIGSQQCFADTNSEILAYADTKGMPVWKDNRPWQFKIGNDTVLKFDGCFGSSVVGDGAGDDGLGATQIKSIYNPISAYISANPLAPQPPAEASEWMGNVTKVETPVVSDQGYLNYIFWDQDFTVKAYIKTYASVYNNPLAERYLRPYLVGGDAGSASFFRSSFLSYNFNSTTITIPPGSTTNFSFNISQTLLNVPMAFLMFSEISYSIEHGSNYLKPWEVTATGPEMTKADGINAYTLHYTMPGLGGDPLIAGAWKIATKVPDGQGAVASLYGAGTGANNQNTFAVHTVFNSVMFEDRNGLEYSKHGYTKYGLLDVFHRSQYYISPNLDVYNVQVAIGPSGWNLYQRPLDIAAMNEVTLNTLTRYDPEMCWSARLRHPNRFRLGDAFACFDLSHDLYRGLFIDSDNMLNITGLLANHGTEPITVYIQCILPYVDHFIISMADSTVSKSQL